MGRKKLGPRAFQIMVFGKLYIVLALSASKARHKVVEALFEAGYGMAYCDVTVRRAYNYDKWAKVLEIGTIWGIQDLLLMEQENGRKKRMDLSEG